ncbi:hypothetical protein SBRCBS47491_007496 [Sporothrix bragantina]|uniref:Cytochrome P450 n=1 Tax=Sporothrix bragantina TaxID=671064 RepID=A0ABP0CEY9_9PEZI
MAHTWLVAFVAIVGVWLASCVHRLYTNYQNAIRSGWPVVVCPVNTQNPFFMVLNAPLRPLIERFLPTAVYNRFHLSTYGWEFRTKSNAVHDRIGPVYVLVTTGTSEIWCADPAVAQIMLTRRKDFVQLPEAKTIMGLLGNNIIASDGEIWARQRRLIAPGLNEKISALVWKESMSQADQMADFMLSQDNGVSTKTVSSLKAIAMNVLGQVGYGQPKPFKPMDLPQDPEAHMEYVDAISIVTELLAAAAIIPHSILSMRFMPKVVQTLGAAMRRLPGLTADMLDKERLRQKTRQIEDDDGSFHGRDNIMSTLVRLSDQGSKANGSNGNSNGNGASSEKALPPTAAHLTEDEISGNLFLVTGAGYDTTANTMSYAAVLLAAYPDKQVWIQEELDSVFGQGLSNLSRSEKTARLEQLDYTTVYPRLARSLAFMYETLRLYPAVLHLSRSVRTTDGPQTVTAHEKTHNLVGPYNVFINNRGLQTDRSVWGKDADDFRPERWIVVDDKGNESVMTPPRGSFSPWSGGPRVCPGMKMSQVEFVVVMSTLLWRCQVKPVKEGQETDADACARLLALTEDSQPRLTLQMNRPDEAILQWVER